VIAVLEDADATGSIDSASDDFLDRRQFLFDLDVAVDDLERWSRCQLEAADRRHVAERLMLSLVSFYVKRTRVRSSASRL